MKSNYDAWSFEVDDFWNYKKDEEKIRFLIKFAVLAPSSHNTQPWSFSINQDKIEVYREISRRLPIADTNDRQLFLSIGCAIENIVIAANYYGYSPIVKYNDNDSSLVAVIELGQPKSQSIGNKDYLIEQIFLRKTNRNKYKSDYIDENILGKISGLGNKNVDIFVVNDKIKIVELGNVAVLASIESMTDPKFRSELSHHVKNNLTESKIGIPGFALGVPTLISFILPYLLRYINMEKIAEKQNRTLFNSHTP